MGERGKRICGEEDLCEFLPAEAGARSERCGFHIDDITACLAAGFYFSLRLAKEAVACPCDSRREGDALLLHPCLDAKARGFIEEDPVASLLIVEGCPFLAEGFHYREKGILRKAGECAAAADGEDLFCAVGIETLLHQHGRRRTDGGLHECDGAVWRLELIDGEAFRDRGEASEGRSAFFPGKALDARFAQEGEEAAGGQMKRKLFEVRSDEPGRGIEWSHEGDLSVNERGTSD